MVLTSALAVMQPQLLPYVWASQGPCQACLTGRRLMHCWQPCNLQLPCSVDGLGCCVDGLAFQFDISLDTAVHNGVWKMGFQFMRVLLCPNVCCQVVYTVKQAR